MSTGRRTVGVIAGAALALLAGTRDAHAYVRYQSSTGLGFAWMLSCLPLPIEVYPGTFTQMPIGEVTGAVTGATAAWSAGAIPCTFIEFGLTAASGPAPRTANDRRNVITFRDTSWCGLAASGACDPLIPYDPAALALTTVRARSTGEIVDADIEINAFHFRWADRVAHPELADRHDLQNALTHELGHVLGLDHSCSFSGTPPLDHAGQPAPDCSNVSAAVAATTMFPSADVGDVTRRTLEADDRAGVCGIYPAAATPCPPGVDGGCVCAPPGADGGSSTDGGPDVDAGQDVGGGGPDASPADAGKASSGGGCGCEAGGRSSSPRSGRALLFAFLAAALGAMAAPGRARRRR